MKDSDRNDWMPGGRFEILALADGWLEYITEARAALWGVSAANLAELSAARDAAAEALEEAVGPEGGRRARAACRAAFAGLRRLMRSLKRRCFLKPPLVDADFTALSLAIPGGGRSPVETPRVEPPFSLSRSGYMQVLVRHGKKLYGCVGAYLRYVVLPPLAEKPKFEQLSEAALLTRLKEHLDFPDTLQGHTLYASLQWQTTRGKWGPPTPIQSVVLG